MKLRGSYTIEAALIMPIVLFCIVLVLEQTMALYSETIAIVKQQEMWREFTPAEMFRQIEFVHEILE